MWEGVSGSRRKRMRMRMGVLRLWGFRGEETWNRCRVLCGK